MGVSRSEWVDGLTYVLDRAYLLDEQELKATATVIYQILSTLKVPQRGEPVSTPAFIAARPASTLTERTLKEITGVGAEQIVPPKVWSKAIISQITQSWPEISEAEVRSATAMFTELLATLEASNRIVAELPAFLLP